MDKTIFKLVTLPEAEAFLDSLAPDVLRKVFYNIRKVAVGVRDSDLFKKLGDSDIWEKRNQTRTSDKERIFRNKKINKIWHR